MIIGDNMKKVILTVLKVIILVVLFAWIVIVFTDYFRVRNGNNPIFCLSEETKEYSDGSNYICNGLGYKMIKYERTCLTATEFGPFIIKERQCE